MLINSSGRVTFNPPLESAMRTNVEGTRNVIAFAKRMKRPALIHTSTCFVAGNRSGEVWEDEELDGYFPRRQGDVGDALLGRAGDRRQRAGRGAIRQLADDAQVLAGLRQQARDRLREENRDPDDEQALKLAVARSRKEWIRSEATKQGVERAAKWGWPNIYTYTKSMGDQLVVRETGIVRAIVRPAIVESAVAFPCSSRAARMRWSRRLEKLKPIGKPRLATGFGFFDLKTGPLPKDPDRAAHHRRVGSPD